MIISLRLTLLITLKVFRKVPIIGFRRAKSLKDILVRVKVLTVKKNEGFYGPCKKILRSLTIIVWMTGK